MNLSNRYRQLCELWLIILTLGAGIGRVSAAADEGRITNERNRDALLEYLRPALGSAGGVGRLYYTTVCHARDGYPIPFPTVKAQAAAKGKTGLAAVRSVFEKNKQATVLQDSPGIIRMTIGGPATAILRTKIYSVTLQPVEQYNPAVAMSAILNTKEVESAMQELKVKFPLVVDAMSVVTPEKGLPHLPRTLRNLTVDEAFDVIAKEFRGIASFGTCTSAHGERMFYVNFFEVLAWRKLQTGTSRH